MEPQEAEELFTRESANELLPLVRSIAAEIVERRNARTALAAARRVLERSNTPEGLRGSLAHLDAQIFSHDEGLRSAREELLNLGIEILREVPLTLGFPMTGEDGQARLAIWHWNEPEVGHGPVLKQGSHYLAGSASDGEAA